MKKSLLLLVVLFISGCQLTVEGPKVQAQIFRKDEPVEARGASPQWAGMKNSGNSVDRWLRKHINTSPKAQ